MKITRITIFLLSALISMGAGAADQTTSQDKQDTQDKRVAQNVGTPAGEAATAYAEGSSVAVGVTAISALAAIALATQNGGDGSTVNTSTTPGNNRGR